MCGGPEPEERRAGLCTQQLPAFSHSSLLHIWTAVVRCVGVCVARLVPDFDVSSTFRTSKIDDVFSTYFCYEDRLTHVHWAGRSGVNSPATQATP